MLFFCCKNRLSQEAEFGGDVIRVKRHRRCQNGFTLIETLITVVLLALMLVGFRYTLEAYWEQINRSWSERYLEQYGNSVVEYIARNIINAKQIDVAANQGTFGTFYVILDDPLSGSYTVTYSSTADDGVTENNDKIISEYPPTKLNNHSTAILGPRESFEVLEFRGEYIYRHWPPYFNPTSFLGRVFKVTIKLKYVRDGDSGTEDYERVMTFTSQVSLKNRFAPVQGETPGIPPI